MSTQSGIKPRKIYFQARRGSSGKTFICRIELVKSKEQSFIKFVKKGTKVKHKKTSHVGTLHSRGDWTLIADLDKKKRKIPLHIAYTELWPDITIILIQPKRW